MGAAAAIGSVTDVAFLTSTFTESDDVYCMVPPNFTEPPEHIAANLVELGAATHSGILREDYEQHKTVMGKVKLDDFAQEFAAIHDS